MSARSEIIDRIPNHGHFEKKEIPEEVDKLALCLFTGLWTYKKGGCTWNVDMRKRQRIPQNRQGLKGTGTSK